VFVKIFQAAAGNLIDSGYDPNKVGFHSQGHLQRWANSPLRNQDPHLWTVILIGLVVFVILIFWKINRDRQKAVAGAGEANKLSDLVSELEAKEKRLMAKITGLDKQYSIGAINQAEYDELCKQYKKALDNIKLKLKKIEELDNAHR